MRRTLGTAVFAGMIGVTLFGIFLTPLFYYVIRGLVRARTVTPALVADMQPVHPVPGLQKIDGDHQQPGSKKPEAITKLTGGAP
jgi:hypothetical protein